MTSVDPLIIDETECDKDFTCLKETPLYCSVFSTLGHSMVALVCQDRLKCRHNKSYGALRVCKCPVRHEIFKKYGK